MRIVTPYLDNEWQAYYDLRWRLLRAPWQQPKGSEKDEFEQNAFHVAVKDDADDIIGVGRIHQLATGEWQIRYMAVEQEYRNAGVGSMILQALEDHARSRGAVLIILNSRIAAVNFYEKHGYRVVDSAPTLFGLIAHKKLQKSLRNFRA